MIVLKIVFLPLVSEFSAATGYLGNFWWYQGVFTFLCCTYFMSWMLWLRLDIFALPCHFLFFVYLVWSNYDTRLASFVKLAAWSYLFSWTSMNLKRYGSSQINPRFNSFAIDNLSTCFYLAFRPSITYFPYQGSITVLSIIIENSKAIHDSR